MSDGDPRVVIFAHGLVGREIVQFALDHNQARAVVLSAMYVAALLPSC